MKIGKMKESKYLTKDDVGDGVLVTITKLEQQNVALDNEPEETKWIMHFKEFSKGLVLNWTNIQLTAKATGSEETDDWPSKKIVLYTDENVSFGGKLVGGIRIRAAKNQEKEFDPDDLPY